jgi:hypothetical protein
MMHNGRPSMRHGPPLELAVELLAMAEESVIQPAVRRLRFSPRRLAVVVL